jgi:hypothetical protein
MNKRYLIALLAALLGSASLHGAENFLVASMRSNSLEQFTTSGNWVRTLATTGPYTPYALAQSPLTGEIFVSTQVPSGASGTILRYQANGTFDVNWDTFNTECGAACPVEGTASLLFDSAGNLWVATAYGQDFALPIYISKYLAADLDKPNPLPQPNPIMANMYRGNQMAFNASGDICIAGFIDEDVKCFNTSTGAQTADYSAEIHASAAGVAEPAGLAFDGANRLYLNSIFTGKVLREVNPGGPIVLLATLTSAPNLLEGNLLLRGSHLYASTFAYPNPLTVSTPDPVFEISNSGTVTNFIYGTAPPALGNDHIWGAAWMILFNDSL